MDASYTNYGYDPTAYGYGETSQGGYRIGAPVESIVPSPLDHEILIVKGEIQHEINIIDQSGDYGLQFKNGRRLLVSELDKLTNCIEPDWLEVDIEKPIKVIKKVLVPTFRHPQFNYVGKLMGPKGTTLQALAKKFRCHVYVLGKGSTKDRDKEQSLYNSGDPQYAHYGGPLHVKVETTAPPAIAYDRVTGVIKVLTELMKPIKEADLEKLLGIPNVDPDKLKNQEEENVAMVATNYLAQNNSSTIDTNIGQNEKDSQYQSHILSNQQPIIPPPSQIQNSNDLVPSKKDVNFAEDYYNNDEKNDTTIKNGEGTNEHHQGQQQPQGTGGSGKKNNNGHGNQGRKRHAPQGKGGNAKKQKGNNENNTQDRSSSQTRGHMGNQRGNMNNMRGGRGGMRLPYQGQSNNWQGVHPSSLLGHGGAFNGNKNNSYGTGGSRRGPVAEYFLIVTKGMKDKKTLSDKLKKLYIFM